MFRHAERNKQTPIALFRRVRVKAGAKFLRKVANETAKKIDKVYGLIRLSTKQRQVAPYSGLASANNTAINHQGFTELENPNRKATCIIHKAVDYLRQFEELLKAFPADLDQKNFEAGAKYLRKLAHETIRKVEAKYEPTEPAALKESNKQRQNSPVWVSNWKPRFY